jgi:hypothetical protein
VTAEAQPCVYGTWRTEGPHEAVDPVVVTIVSTDAGPDQEKRACRCCVPIEGAPQ